MRNRIGIPTSEFAICESLVYPILKEVWKHFPQFKLWSHVPLKFNDDLSGTPDYILARLSPLGTPVMEEPYLLVVEAKQDDFDWGWGQCLAAMLAAQKVNSWPDQIMGMASPAMAVAGSSANSKRSFSLQDPRSFDWLPLEQGSAPPLTSCLSNAGCNWPLTPGPHELGTKNGVPSCPSRNTRPWKSHLRFSI